MFPLAAAPRRVIKMFLAPDSERPNADGLVPHAGHLNSKQIVARARLYDAQAAVAEAIKRYVVAINANAESLTGDDVMATTDALKERLEKIRPPAASLINSPAFPENLVNQWIA